VSNLVFSDLAGGGRLLATTASTVLLSETGALLPLTIRVSQSELIVRAQGDGTLEIGPALVRHREEWWLTVAARHRKQDVIDELVLAPSAMPAVAEPAELQLSVTTRDGDTRDWARGRGRADLAALRPSMSFALGSGAEGNTEEGTVIFHPWPGAVVSPATSAVDARLLTSPEGPPLHLHYQVVDISSTGQRPLAKPERELSPIDETGWRSLPEVRGLEELILSSDAHTGLVTRLARFAPGTETGALGVLRHHFWEEAYMLEGTLHDLTLGETFVAGSYACRPPGMPHGPWRSDTGCTVLEIRYPAR
jgi:hypothetical protein